jgi:hypothetical protein
MGPEWLTANRVRRVGEHVRGLLLRPDIERKGRGRLAGPVTKS